MKTMFLYKVIFLINLIVLLSFKSLFAGEFINLVNEILEKKGSINTKITDSEREELSIKARGLETNSFPKVGFSLFAREYYLSDYQLNTDGFGLITSENVLGTSVLIRQDILGLLTNGYGGIRKPIERNASLVSVKHEMERTNKYLSIFIHYLVHLRRTERDRRAEQLILDSNKYLDPSENASAKVVNKMIFTSMGQLNKTDLILEKAICEQYENALTKEGLKSEMDWAEMNVNSFDLTLIANDLTSLKSIHDFEEKIDAEITENLEKELEQRQESSWLDNLSFNLDFQASAYGNSLASQETQGNITIQYLFNSPNEFESDAERKGLKVESLNSRNNYFALGDSKFQYLALSKMKDEDFIKLGASLMDQERNFDNLFKVTKLGGLKSDLFQQSISSWIAYCNQLENIYWEKVLEILTAHEYAVNLSKY